MGTYVEIGGLRTWYDEQGTGDPLVLLHGGLVTNETWGMQLPAFAERFHVYAPERRAHGHTPDVEGPLNYDDMAADTIGFIESVVGGPAALVGWSDGGNVGLLVAVARPDLVRKLVVVGSNFAPSGESSVPGAAEMSEQMTPDSPDLAMFRGLYEAASPDGADHWPVVVGKLLEMWSTQPDIPLSALARIEAPTLVVVSDDDMMTFEHTLELYRAIPNSELAVLPGTSHALLMEKPDLANRIILDFLEKEPVPTMMPFRRASHDGH